MNKIIEKRKLTRHGNISIDRNVNVAVMLFVDDQILSAESEDQYTM
jgi:hypothetical protein